MHAHSYMHNLLTRSTTHKPENDEVELRKFSKYHLLRFQDTVFRNFVNEINLEHSTDVTFLKEPVLG